MYSRVSIVIVFCVFIFAGCSFFPGEIKTAERLMETAPDSALQILRNVNYDKSLSAAERANYGLLLFEALDKTYQPLKPDSVLNFSIDYYKRKRNSEKLAKGYFYKGRSYNYVFQYENASKFYMLALDNLKGTNDYNLLAKIYSDLGDICTAQNDFEQARDKYLQSVSFFERAGKFNEALYDRIDIGNTYRSQREFRKAHGIFLDILNTAKDSVLIGITLQEIGVNYFWVEKYDSSIIFLKRSVKYPYRDYYQSIKFLRLSDSYFEIGKLDSALLYAKKSLTYPANFYTKRECYRVLANTAYLNGNYKEMAGYMTYYQAMSDSVRIIDTQTKSTIIEDIHVAKEKVSKAKRWLWTSLSILPVFLLVGVLIYIRLQSRRRGAEVELEQKSEKLVVFEQKLHENQEQLRSNLIFKIDELKRREFNKIKRPTLFERQEIERRVFLECLYFDDTSSFDTLMNLTFNNIVDKLNKAHPELSRNELMYCCLILLELSNQEILLILQLQLNSIYKIKQRIAQKFNLFSTTEIVPYLQKLWLN